MAFDLKDRFETSDGSRPDASPLSQAHGDKLPLTAFTVLSGGDVFESSGRGIVDKKSALAYCQSKVRINPHGAQPQLVQKVTGDIANQLAANAPLLQRMQLTRSIVVELIPPNQAMAKYGFPKNCSATAAGLFWNKPDWDQARIALRQEHLLSDPSLVFHEMGHAIHYLGFTQKERELIYRVLQPTFFNRMAMDEVFAIYGERELAGEYDKRAKKAPGVYGFTRRQWSENHVFTRFVRKLYFPHKPTAGHKMAPAAGGDWMKGLGRR